MRSIHSQLILLTTYLEVVKLKRDVSSRTQRCTEAIDQRNSPTLMTLKVCTHDALFVSSTTIRRCVREETSRFS